MKLKYPKTWSEEDIKDFERRIPEQSRDEILRLGKLLKDVLGPIYIQMFREQATLERVEE